MATRILGLMVIDRIKEAGETQKVLTEYSEIIKSRIGFHEVTDNVCSRHGVILLQLAGNPELCSELESKLHDIMGIQVKSMEFDANMISVGHCEN